VLIEKFDKKEEMYWH